MHRQQGLDICRATAIVWVMVYHASNFGLIEGDRAIISFGWMGVDLFFVLSGFLIAGQLFKPLAEGQLPDFARFFTRRLLRTLPAFLAMLVVYFALPQWREQWVIQPLWQFLTFTQNFFIRLDTPKAFSHAWSLCVEEQFYLLLPLALLALRGRGTRFNVVLLLVGLCVAGMVLRGVLWLQWVEHAGGEYGFARAYMAWIYYPTWSRLDPLLFGVTLALIRLFRPSWWAAMERRTAPLALAGCIGVGGSMVFFGGQLPTFWPAVLGYPLLAISLALLVAAAAMPHSPISRLRVPGARMLAIGAYSLYLSHKMVFKAVSDAAEAYGQTGTVVLLVGFGLAFAVGALLYFCIERPFLLLRERIDRSERLLPRTTIQA